MGTLRFILALAVIISHAGPLFGVDSVGGTIAVEAFYIISGFYMCLVLNEKYIGANGSYKLFITNRYLRLAPAYWCVIALVLVYSVVCGIVSDGSNWANLSFYVAHGAEMDGGSWIFLVFTNVFIFFQDVAMFLGLSTDGHLYFTPDFQGNPLPLRLFLLIPAAWTLGIELAFYVIAPFIVRRGLMLIGAILLASLAVRYYLFHNGFDHEPWTYRFFPAELCFFMLGCVAWHIYRRIKDWKIRPLHLGLVWAALVLCTIFYAEVDFNQKQLVFILLFFAALPFIFLHTKNMKADQYIGELSYPIYIAHLFIFGLVHQFAFLSPNGVTLFACLFSILAAVLLHEVVLKKVEKRRQRRLTAAGK